MPTPHACTVVATGYPDALTTVSGDATKRASCFLCDPPGDVEGYSLLFKVVAPLSMWDTIPDLENKVVKVTGGLVAIPPTCGGTVHMRINATALEDMGSRFA